jgi:hypothetical protein
MATAPAAASALLSETEEPPPPVLGAPVGTAPPDFADEPPALAVLEVLEEPPAVLGGTATVEPPLFALLAGVAVADGSAAVEPVPLDLAADESPLDLLEPLLDPPVEVSMFMPGGMAVTSVPDAEWDALGVDFAVGAVTATVLPPEEDDEPVEEEADVDFAVGRVTTVVLPPEEADEPVEEEADVDFAVGRLVATVLLAPVEAAVGTSVGALVAVAAGAPALDVVSFCDHRPISESTPARTAIAMIAPTTQDVLFG